MNILVKKTLPEVKSFCETNGYDEGREQALLFLIKAEGPVPKTLLEAKLEVDWNVEMPDRRNFDILANDELEWAVNLEGKIETGFSFVLDNLGCSNIPSSYIRNMARQTDDGLVIMSGNGQNVLEKIEPILKYQECLLVRDCRVSYLGFNDLHSRKPMFVMIPRLLEGNFYLGLQDDVMNLYATCDLPCFLKGYQFGHLIKDSTMKMFVQTDLLTSYPALGAFQMQKDWHQHMIGMRVTVDGVQYDTHYFNTVPVAVFPSDTEVIVHFRDEVYKISQRIKQLTSVGYYRCSVTRETVPRERCYVGRCTDKETLYFNFTEMDTQSLNPASVEQAMCAQELFQYAGWGSLLHDSVGKEVVSQMITSVLDPILPPVIPSFGAIADLVRDEKNTTISATLLKCNVVTSQNRVDAFAKWEADQSSEAGYTVITDALLLDMVAKFTRRDGWRGRLDSKKFFSELLRVGCAFSYRSVYTILRRLGCYTLDAMVYVPARVSKSPRNHRFIQFAEVSTKIEPTTAPFGLSKNQLAKEVVKSIIAHQPTAAILLAEKMGLEKASFEDTSKLFKDADLVYWHEEYPGKLPHRTLRVTGEKPRKGSLENQVEDHDKLRASDEMGVDFTSKFTRHELNVGFVCRVMKSAHEGGYGGYVLKHGAGAHIFLTALYESLMVDVLKYTKFAELIRARYGMMRGSRFYLDPGLRRPDVHEDVWTKAEAKGSRIVGGYRHGPLSYAQGERY